MTGQTMADDHDNTHMDCPLCDGRGQIRCTDCIGGEIVDDDLQMVDCNVCDGIQSVPCSYRCGPL